MTPGDARRCHGADASSSTDTARSGCWRRWGWSRSPNYDRGLMSAFLPYGTQTIEPADIDAVSLALSDPFITQGPRVEEFERRVAELVEARHAVAFSSGTAALHGAAAAAALGPGDELL